jgi:hypothetical protein
MYHMFSPSSNGLERKTLCQSSKGWMSVFHLPVACKVGGEILFRLLVLNSIWILVLTVADKGPPCCNTGVRSVATRVLIYYVLELVFPHFV